MLFKFNPVIFASCLLLFSCEKNLLFPHAAQPVIPMINEIEFSGGDGCSFTKDTPDRYNDSVQVLVTMVPGIASFTNNHLKIMLMEYNPIIADVPSCLASDTIIPLSHQAGDSLLFSYKLFFSRSDSLRYTVYADLYTDSALGYGNQTMYSACGACGSLLNNPDTITVQLKSIAR